MILGGKNISHSVCVCREQTEIQTRWEEKWSSSWKSGTSCLWEHRRRSGSNITTLHWAAETTQLMNYLFTSSVHNIYGICVLSRRVQRPLCGTSTRLWLQVCPSSCVSSCASSWSPPKLPNSSQYQQHTCFLLVLSSVGSCSVITYVHMFDSTEGTTVQGSASTWGRSSHTLPASSAKTRSGSGGPSPVRGSTRSVWQWMTPPAWWTTTPNR